MNNKYDEMKESIENLVENAFTSRPISDDKEKITISDILGTIIFIIIFVGIVYYLYKIYMLF
jgi:hypothetical protein